MLETMRRMIEQQQQASILQQQQIAQQQLQATQQQEQIGLLRDALLASQRFQAEMQQQQMTVIRDGIVAAQQTATAAVERATATAATAPHGQRPGSIADFMKLNPKAFTGNEEPLAAEQWLTDMTNFLEAANIPAADHVKVVKIQLKDIARSWWLAEEAKQHGQLTWKQFSDGFYERFFPQRTKQEMGEKFLRLKQWDKTVDQYAAEFQRLSRFAPNMVKEEIDWASRL